MKIESRPFFKQNLKHFFSIESGPLFAALTVSAFLRFLFFLVCGRPLKRTSIPISLGVSPSSSLADRSSAMGASRFRWSERCRNLQMEEMALFYLLFTLFKVKKMENAISTTYTCSNIKSVLTHLASPFSDLAIWLRNLLLAASSSSPSPSSLPARTSS